jgi:chromosome segregation ATPase
MPTFTSSQYRALEVRYKKVVELSKQLQAKVDELSKGQSSGSGLVKEYNELKASFENLTKREKLEIDALNNLSVALQTYKDQVAHFTAENPVVAPSDDTMTDRVVELSKELDACKKQVDDMQKQITSLNKLNTDISSELVKKNKECSDMSADLSKKAEELKTASEKVTSLQTELDSTKENYTTAKAALDEANTEKKTLQDKTSEQEKQIGTLNADIAKLQEKVKKLTEEGVPADDGSTTEDSYKKVSMFTVKPQEGITFKANGKVIDGSVFFLKGSSVTIECFKDGIKTKNFVYEEY